jgi:Fic family protein
VRKEAVASSKIEGTQADLGQLVLFEELDVTKDPASDVREVSNYVQALNYGLVHQTDQPVSLWLVRAMHARLMEGVRSDDLSPGTFRIRQNYIARQGQSIRRARYIPPPPTLVPDLLENLEQYITSASPYPPLIRLAFVHYQFEAIHPFVDGNGRLGRLLISLLLCKWDILPVPMLYLSDFFERRRTEYVDCLLRVSTEGQWKAWILFFLEGVRVQARDAVVRSDRLMRLRESYRSRYQDRRTARMVQTIDMLFERPVLSIPRLAKVLGITYRSARAIVTTLVNDGILEELTGQARNRVYGAMEIFDVLTSDTPVPDSP